MHPFITTGIRAGLRGKSIQAILILGFLLVGAAHLTGNFSPRHPQTVALDVGFSFLRITLVFLVLFWMQELVSKEIDKKTILFTLAYPTPRSHYLLGRYCAILVLAAIACTLLAGLLWLAVTYAGGNYQQQYPVNLSWDYWLTILGIYLDAAVVAAFALWISTLSTTPLLPMAIGFIFAISGKALGAVIAYLNSNDGKNDELAAKFSSSINQIQWVLPDLSRLDWRLPSLYPAVPLPNNLMALSSLMALSYIALMLCLAILFFKKREFF